jgi:hypothetical protein
MMWAAQHNSSGNWNCCRCRMDVLLAHRSRGGLQLRMDKFCLRLTTLERMAGHQIFVTKAATPGKQ